MKIVNVHGVICLLFLSLFATQTWSANVLNSDSDFSVKIAVTINEDDHIMGKLEYSNHEPQYPLQLVTFNPIGGVIHAEPYLFKIIERTIVQKNVHRIKCTSIHAEPYLFKIIERTIVQKNVHRIKCTSINDKYGAGSLIIGTIDFRDEFKPKVHLVNENGHTYIGNLTDKGKEMHQKYIPNVWLGH